MFESLLIFLFVLALLLLLSTPPLSRQLSSHLRLHSLQGQFQTSLGCQPVALRRLLLTTQQPKTIVGPSRRKGIPRGPSPSQWEWGNHLRAFMSESRLVRFACLVF
jgi:hypothetical protein